MTKATMLIQNTIGAIVLRHINIISLTEDEQSVSIRYKMKGGRSVQGYKISKKETSLIIAEG